MMYFDDFTVGAAFTSPGRTVTEADVVLFAGLTGDYNDIHMNVEAAKQRAFGERIAHGLLVLSLTRGLLFRSRITGTDAERAFLGLPDVTFKHPVKLGDTIHIKATVEALHEESANDGKVLLRCEAVNQEGKVTQESRFLLLMDKRTRATG